MNKVINSVIAGGAIVGLGYALMKLTVPSDKELIERLPPNMQKEATRLHGESAAKNAALRELIQKSVDTDRPVWETGTKR
ncbi:hypothetical protein BZG36_01801 [Bifiguratus adelaidae]|uniref:Cytochrome b mRNA-processing protein 4 n=1 Tax=Bifiguratus adelaidae TaxID=1938954 RepID=A0A261Y299_9FUNG|nr:hypothetical protein BZG36_01801 [Bifiguratus adelaidae]